MREVRVGRHVRDASDQRPHLDFILDICRVRDVEPLAPSLCSDHEGAGDLGRRLVGVAIRLRVGTGGRATVGFALSHPGAALRPWPPGGEVGGGAACRSAASTSLSPDIEWPRVCSDVCDSVCGAEAKQGSARASGCVIAALLVLALVVLVATFAVPAIVCVLRIRAAADNDVARLLLALAVQGLPADRADWAQAMLVEFDRVEGRRE